MFKSSLAWADQYTWVDFREPFAENITVCHDKSIVVNIKLPDTFLKNHENITLGVEVNVINLRRTKRHNHLNILQ